MLLEVRMNNGDVYKIEYHYYIEDFIDQCYQKEFLNIYDNVWIQVSAITSIEKID